MARTSTSAAIVGRWPLRRSGSNGTDTQNQTASTATFSTKSGRGTYTLTVTNISKTGYTFDPANSSLTKSVTK
jgi:hypothetical protein